MSLHFKGNILDYKIRMWTISAIECFQLIEVKYSNFSNDRTIAMELERTL